MHRGSQNPNLKSLILGFPREVRTERWMTTSKIPGCRPRDPPSTEKLPVKLTKLRRCAQETETPSLTSETTSLENPDTAKVSKKPFFFDFSEIPFTKETLGQRSSQQNGGNQHRRNSEQTPDARSSKSSRQYGRSGRHHPQHLPEGDAYYNDDIKSRSSRVSRTPRNNDYHDKTVNKPAPNESVFYFQTYSH